MKHIAIISDTHGLLREQVMAELVIADCTIHAGDMDTPDVVSAMRQYGETYMVRGNNDKDWAENISGSIKIEIEGVNFFVVHNKKDVPKNLTNIDVVIYGHSHKYSAQVKDGVLYLNPGSCGKRRFGLDLTMCRMTVDAGEYQFEKVDIPSDSFK